MTELPMDAESSTTPEAARALAAIAAAKLVIGEDVAECLDAVGDLIRITGQPDAVFAWVIDTLGREELRVFAARHRIKLHESRAVDEDLLNRTVIIWAVDGEGMAIIPTKQRPAVTLLQLREEIAQREEELTLAAAFQASVVAGHVKDVETWHARTTQAAT